MIKIIKKILVTLSRNLIKLSNKLILLLSEKGKVLPLQSINYTETGRYYNFAYTNPTSLWGKPLFNALFDSLMSEPKFLGFGEKKVILVTGTAKGVTFTLHHNVLLTNLTPFENY